jgi:hypothetical protein
LEIANFVRRIRGDNTDDNCLCFLFDIHGTKGFSEDKDIDIYIGTNDGESISGLLEVNSNALWDNHGLIRSLRNQGYKTYPRKKNQLEKEELDGGLTVTKYGSTNGVNGLEAIQLEFTPYRRDNPAERKRLEKALARSIIKMVSQYSNEI